MGVHIISLCLTWVLTCCHKRMFQKCFCPSRYTVFSLISEITLENGSFADAFVHIPHHHRRKQLVSLCPRIDNRRVIDMPGPEWGRATDPCMPSQATLESNTHCLWACPHSVLCSDDVFFSKGPSLGTLIKVVDPPATYLVPSPWFTVHLYTEYHMT